MIGKHQHTEFMQQGNKYGKRCKEKTLSKSKKKEKSRDVYVCMYECVKNFLHLMYERT